MDSILFSKTNGVALITLNRPKVFNSFNSEMRKNLLSKLENCAADPSVRAVMITGEGRAFCAGQDLGEATQADAPISFNNALKTEYNPIILKIKTLGKPVVAAVNGVAAGAGTNLALACDIVVAAESATFIQVFSSIGLIPDCGGTWVLPRLVGFARATALMMLDDKVSAVEAVQMGMIYKYFPDEDFKNKALAIAEKLAKMPTRSLALTKKALNASMFSDFEQQLTLEAEYQEQAGATDDYTEGVNAFIQKRQPIFKGQ